MCTVSWLYEDGGYHLFSSRDEKFSRSAAEPPRVFESDGVRYIAPRDCDFGGSWIAANEAGVSLCLLNGANAGGSERRRPAAGESRGWVVVRLAGGVSQSDAVRSLRAIPLQCYAAFTLLVLEPGRRALALEWDGEDLATHDGELLIPLASSSRDADAARRVRTALYGVQRPRTVEAHTAFHASHGPQRGELSPCMHRDDAATVSFTHVRVAPGLAAMTYRSGPLCAPRAASPRRFMLPYFLIALSTLASEDLTCVATGVLVAQGKLPFAAGALACAFGIFAGDLLLVLAGRSARFPSLRRRASSLTFLDRHAGWKLALTRFTPGLRLPTYVSAGLRGIPIRRVVPPLLAGAAVWTPILVGMTAVAGAALVMSGLRALEWSAALAVIARLVISLRIHRWETRRRAYAFFCRAARWEFWPSWAAYLPLVPYLLWLAVKHRGATVFTAANPGIPTGGLVGESKAEILRQLRREPDLVAITELIAPNADALRGFMTREGLSFPVVLKPDVGERGSGVAIIRSEQAAQHYLTSAGGPVITQEYVPGPEFGVLYGVGRVLSITEKRMPEVIGDGTSSIEKLILADPRAFCLEGAYRRAARLPLSYVPEPGERVKLVEIGSHCRGAIFLDATHLRTPELEAAVDQLARLTRASIMAVSTSARRALRSSPKVDSRRSS